jgi:hypothetical protein
MALAYRTPDGRAIAQSAPPLNRDPAAVKFVTSDIGNFWRAYDLAAKESDKEKRVAVFQAEYLDKGSPGLKDFLRLRIKSAENLVGAIDRMPKYYASIWPQTLAGAAHGGAHAGGLQEVQIYLP